MLRYAFFDDFHVQSRRIAAGRQKVCNFGNTFATGLTKWPPSYASPSQCLEPPALTLTQEARVSLKRSSDASVALSLMKICHCPILARITECGGAGSLNLEADAHPECTPEDVVEGWRRRDWRPTETGAESTRDRRSICEVLYHEERPNPI